MVKIQDLWGYQKKRSEFAQQAGLHNSAVTLAKSLEVWSHYGEEN